VLHVPLCMNFVPEEMPALLKGHEPRRSVCLKIKGLSGFGKNSSIGYMSSNPGSCPLLDSFLFPRLSSDEISDLFRSYRVILGDNDTHRNLIVEHVKHLPRDFYDSTISQMLHKCKKNSYELVTLYPTVTEEGTIVII
jgi:hypothetical protein